LVRFFFRVEGVVCVVLDPEAAAHVYGANGQSIGAQVAHQLRDTLSRCAKWIRAANLRTDMHAYAAGVEKFVLCRCLIDCSRLTDIDAELMLAQACRNVRVRLGEDIGIDTQGEPRALP
jgi:hypothetical protein